MIRALVLASRPRTLAVSVASVAVGSAVAVHPSSGAEIMTFRPWISLAAVVAALFIQIGTNLANDVFDFERGADGPSRLGPPRAVAGGLLSARAARIATWVSFVCAVAAGGCLVWARGPWVVAIGAASILSGLAYTAGPFPLAYHGLGEAFVILFFGFVAVSGAAFVQLGWVPSLALSASVPVGALAAAILVVNNLRDRETDRAASKRTLVVRFGRRWGIGEYSALLAASHVVPVLLVLGGRLSPFGLLPLLTLPFAFGLVVEIERTDGAKLNRTLARTAGLLLAFALLFAVAIAADAFVAFDRLWPRALAGAGPSWVSR